MGVVLVDVGAGITEIAVFQEGCISAYDVIPVGGNLITNDIAIGLRLPYAKAEELKCKYACAISSLASDKPDIEIQSLGDAATRKISQRELASIIEPRVQEILSYIINTIAGLNLKTMLPAGIVFTGGGLVHINGFLEMAQQLLEFPVRIGSTDSYGKEQSFTVALGLLNYLIKHRTYNTNSTMRERSASGFFERAKQILREYF